MIGNVITGMATAGKATVGKKIAGKAIDGKTMTGMATTGINGKITGNSKTNGEMRIQNARKGKHPKKQEAKC